MKKFLSLLLLFALSLSAVAVSAQDTAEETAPASIIDVAAGAEGFGTLIAAIEAADLTETLSTGEYTVFAPANGAFSTLFNNLGMEADEILAETDLLESILTYHVIEGTTTFADLENLAAERNDGLVTVTTLSGQEMRIQVDANANTATINEGAAIITQADLLASNGVIHMINNVLLPPTPETRQQIVENALENEEPVQFGDAQTDSIPDILTSNSDFETLVAALDEAELTNTLSMNEYTVFAPTDGAFGTLLTNTSMSGTDLFENTEFLTNVLTYHVVEGSVSANDLVEMIEAAEDGIATVNTLNGAELNFTMNADENVVVINEGSASVIQADVAASNGLIHVVDNVLLVPAEEAMDEMVSTDDDMMESSSEMTTQSIVDAASSYDRFSILAAAIAEAELTETLETGNYTVFAPTDEAFDNLISMSGVTADELMSSELLDEILLYHVVEGRFTAEDVIGLDGSSVQTALDANGIGVEVSEEGNVILNGVVNITETDITAGNGVIHAIDEVLLPQEAIDALGL